MTNAGAGPVSSARRVLVLLNPGAGQGRILRRTVEGLESGCGPELELLIPDPDDQARQFLEAEAALTAGADAVIVCGGDGMINLAANLVAQTGVPLGIIPTGSGNDFARALGVPRRSSEAVDRVLQSLAQPELLSRRVDALRISTSGTEPRWVVNSVNIGFDARVNQRANAQSRAPRKLRYLTALAQEVPRFAPVEFTVQVNSEGERLQRSALVCIQNGTFIGGGIPLALGGRPDDGIAEVSHVQPLSRPGLVALFPLLMLRMHRWLGPLVTQSIQRIRIGIPEGVPVYADGDELPCGAADCERGVVLDIELIPGALALLR